MTFMYESRALLNIDMPSWYYDGVTAKTRNLGTLGGTVQLGDGTTVGTFPTQVFPHGMSFDGGSDYLLYPDNAALSFGNGVIDQPFSVEVFVRGSDFADYVIDAFDWLVEESRESPRMMSIGLHTRIVGRPGRIGGLKRVIDHVRAQSGVWVATREQIARYEALP